MALLLAMYQKMRLIREKNQLVLDQTKVSSKLTRVQKNIERVQKRYTSLFANLDSQAKMMQSQAKVGIQGLFGLGTNSVNPYDYSGINGFVYGVMGKMFANDWTGRTDAQGNALPDVPLGQDLLQRMMNEYMSNGGKFIPELDADNKQVYENNQPKYKNFTADQIACFTQAMQNGKMAQQQAQFNAQQMTTQYESNVSIWLDAQKAALEAEQDAMLEPLNYEETMLELEKEQKDTRLQRINEEIETYKQLVSQEVKNTTPTFGLG